MSYHCLSFVIVAVTFVLKINLPLLYNFALLGFLYHSLGLSSSYQIHVGSWKDMSSEILSFNFIYNLFFDIKITSLVPKFPEIYIEIANTFPHELASALKT